MKDDLSNRVVILEMQMKRFISDLESEKGTRARIHADMETRLRAVEIANWKAAGALGVLILVIQFAPKILHAIKP